jgi:hypothetical protein
MIFVYLSPSRILEWRFVSPSLLFLRVRSVTLQCRMFIWLVAFVHFLTYITFFSAQAVCVNIEEMPVFQFTIVRMYICRMYVCLSEKWFLKLNINKCKVVSYGHHIDFNNAYYLQSDGANSVLENLNLIKDLGVTIDSKLKFDHHIIEKVDKAYSVLGLIYIYAYIYVRIATFC